MKAPLTNRQAEILSFIELYIEDKGWPPTRVEIADEFNIQPAAAQDHVKAIANKGYIKIKEGVSRGIKVMK